MIIQYVLVIDTNLLQKNNFSYQIITTFQGQYNNSNISKQSDMLTDR
jgi:hypothetical protein